MQKINVFITVDTEHSIGGAFRDPKLKPVGNEKRIFGKIGNKYYGIPLIMDIADEYGIPLTFFVEVMSALYFGVPETKKVCDYIINRGNDVQLHIHPEFLFVGKRDPKSDTEIWNLGLYPENEQVSIIRKGIRILRKCGVKDVKIFRAGSFGASNGTLRALANNGIFIDSSYCATYSGTACVLEDARINDVTKISGVWEIPVTNFETTSLRNKYCQKPMDVNGVGFLEMRSVLEEAVKFGPRTVTVLLHSFSFIKPYDVQYRKVRPRNIVIKRFEKFCRFLAENKDKFVVRTFGSLTQDELVQMASEAKHVFPKAPKYATCLRLAEQLFDEII